MNDEENKLTNLLFSVTTDTNNIGKYNLLFKKQRKPNSNKTRYHLRAAQRAVHRLLQTQ